MAKVTQSEKFYLGVRPSNDVFYVGFVGDDVWQENTRIYFPPLKEINWQRLLRHKAVQSVKQGTIYKFSPVLSSSGLKAIEEEFSKVSWVDVVYIEP